jgi:flagellar basal body rod protein FlgG
MRPDTLRTAADALRYWELRQQVAANNLANAQTPGFKGERVFARLLEGATPQSGARTDLTTGALRPTGNPLDIAIAEPRNFLVITTDAGERLIRGGALRLDDGGRLVDAAGHALLGENGPIAIPQGANVSIEGDGTVRADGVVVDTLRIETVGGPDDVTHEAGGVFFPRAARRAEGADRALRQGFIEESNIDTLSSMIDMIEIQRNFAAVQGSLRTVDGVLDTIANQIGRIG